MQNTKEMAFNRTGSNTLFIIGDMVSCTGSGKLPDGESPSAVVEAFYQAVNEGDIPKAQQYVGDVPFMEAADLVVGNI